MRKPNAFVLWRPGVNCHHETADAFRLAGANPRIVLWEELLRAEVRLTDADLLAFPGGFADGDHFRAGGVAAIALSMPFLKGQLQEARSRKIPMIGICNGFQILVALGILPGGEIGHPTAALDTNLTSRFEHRFRTKLYFPPSAESCVWTSALAGQYAQWPVGHGEGRLVTSAGERCNVVALYGCPTGDASYPASPNGSSVAGICSDDGTVVGFMPHPERRIDGLHGGDSGLRVFESAVEAVR